MILAGDVGGTKTVLALFERSGELHPVRDATFASREHGSLEEMLAKFLGDPPRVRLEGACLGVAGPVIDGKCGITNLDWQLDEETLAVVLRVPRVTLLNDLEATAYGMLCLSPHELLPLHPPHVAARRGNAAVIAAGTGLGEGILFWDGTRYQAIASEGGHADFAPRTEREIALLRCLREESIGHVSYERVLTGSGLVRLYRFLRRERGEPEPAWLAQRLGAGDPSVAVTEVGLAGEDAACVDALNWFSEIYGAEAGNLALKSLAVGGVFVGGGIAPKILPVLQNGSFMRGFVDKGRFADLLRTISVKIATNPRAALLGAAHHALRE
jgi:glucokinase